MECSVTQFLDSDVAKFAIEAVREASILVRRVQAEMIGEAITKDDKSPVTVADFAAQAIVARRLAERFPDAVLVGEESSGGLKDAGSRATLEQITRFVQTVEPGATSESVCEWIDRGSNEAPKTYWTLDPVDGTKGFLRKDQYAVALALVENGRVVLGALGCPELEDGVRPAKGGVGSILLAMRGEGAWVQSLAKSNGKWTRLTTSKISDPTGARLLRSVEKSHTDADSIGDLADKLGVTADPVPMDSQAKYSVLAAGGGDVILRLLSPSRPNYREMIWDQAAGSIVVEEAGGRVSDLDGKPLDFSHGRTLATNRGVLVTNGPLHEAFLAGLKAIGA
jgi:3'(2'), 5'-bisphosphate nucleotidase